MLISKEFEKHILECLKDAVQDAAPDLFNDLVEDNPDFWAQQLHALFKSQMKLALQDKRLIKELLREFLEDQYPLEDILADIIRDERKRSRNRNN